MSNSNPTHPGTFRGDFRQPAAYESERIIAENRSDLPTDCSLCLPTGEDEAVLRGHGTWVLVRFIVGMLGIVGGGAAAAFLERHDQPPVAIGLGLGASMGGIALLLSNNFFMGRFARRHLGQRYDELLALPRDGGVKLISIEDAHSFSKFKLVPEDIGFLILDIEARTLTVEGVVYRYVVHGEDVLDVKQHRGGNSTATTVTYAIGRAELSIALQQTSLRHEFKKQTIGAKRDPLLRAIESTLAYQELEVLD
jgi:hypothetical protein